MKRLAAALILSLLAVPALAQVGSIPQLNERGQPFRATQYSGKVLVPHTSTSGGNNANGVTHTSTVDYINFGFLSDYVRVCLHPSSNQTYIRFATTLSASHGAITTMGNPDFTAPGTTSANFINGVSNTRQAHGAFTMAGTTSAQASINAVSYICETHPWRTRGLVVHIASGSATIDAAGFRDNRTQ